jgi:hypothetical protein
MDVEQVDAVARRFADGRSRRGLTRTLAAGVDLALVGRLGAPAGAKHGTTRKRHHGQGLSFDPGGYPVSGQCCANGYCARKATGCNFVERDN